MNTKSKVIRKPAMMTAAPKPSKTDQAKLLTLVKKFSSGMGKLDKVSLVSAIREAVGVSPHQVLHTQRVLGFALPELSEKENKDLQARIRKYGKDHPPKVPKLRGTTERMPCGAVYVR